MSLKCQCCGFESDLDLEEAFQAGWDAPPHFTVHVCCPLCPAVCLMDKSEGHTKAHAHWAKHGRPAEFALETCASDSVFGDKVEMAAAEAGMAAIDEFFQRLRSKVN